MNEHASVKLVAVTKSNVEGIDTPEELIVYTARVSNPDNQMNKETSDRLIAYLVKNKHWSPFEMVDMTVEIKTSRAIAAQILRHRSFSFQEFSQRYAEVTEMMPVQLRMQAETNRQSSTIPVFDKELLQRVETFVAESQGLYQELLERGVARECARMVLPLTTQTTLYMKGSVRSWIHYLQLRLDPHTQVEHRQVAECIFVLFEKQFPNITKALNLRLQ